MFNKLSNTAARQGETWALGFARERHLRVSCLLILVSELLHVDALPWGYNPV